MTATRVYVVQEAGSNKPRLIRATFRATAIRHASHDRFTARIATRDDLEHLITAGVRVELAVDPKPGDDAEPEAQSA